MSERYGKYWSEDDLIITTVNERDQLPHALFKDPKGSPAIIVGLFNANTHTISQFLFVEVVPGTEHTDYYMNLATNQFELGTMVEVTVYSGPTMDFDDMLIESREIWAFDWLKIKELPKRFDDPYTAYQRAMGVIS